MIEVDLAVLTLLAGTIVPVLVGLVTKMNASSTFKAVANAALSAVAGVLAAALATGGTIDVDTALMGALTTWIASIATYYGLWKPTEISTKVAERTQSFGLGSESDPQTV